MSDLDEVEEVVELNNESILTDEEFAAKETDPRSLIKEQRST